MYRIFYILNNRYEMEHCNHDMVGWHIRRLEAQGATIKCITNEYGSNCKREEFLI